MKGLGDFQALFGSLALSGMRAGEVSFPSCVGGWKLETTTRNAALSSFASML